MTTFFKNQGKRIISIALVFACMLMTIQSAFMYGAKSGSSNLIGSNLALGSPLLNSQFTADSWNKYETIVWGIFLSNFCIPFVDDYQSAFSSSSSSGSKGSGLSALSFASGSDYETSETIQGLLDYSLSNQRESVSPISVSYNYLEGSKYDETQENEFTGSNSTPAAASRQAVVSDLFFKSNFLGLATSDPDKFANSTWVEPATLSPDGYADAAYGLLALSLIDGAFLEIYSKLFSPQFVTNTADYASFHGVSTARVPTFAINATNSNPEVILDLRDSWDIEMLVGAYSKAFTSEYAEEAAVNLATMWNSPLVLDCFGNICASHNGRNIVIIPASANQYLKTDKSYNLVNSLIFNASSAAADSDMVVLQAGTANQEGQGFDAFKNWVAGDIVYTSGGLAFTNGAASLGSGMILYYDTDTILVQKMLKLLDGEAVDGLSIGNLNVIDIDVKAYLDDLYETDINDPNCPYPFKVEPANLDLDGIAKVIQDKSGADDATKLEIIQSLANTAVASSSLANLAEPNVGVPRLTHLEDYRDGSTIYLFGEQNKEGRDTAVVFPIQLPAGVDSNNTYNTQAVYRLFGNFLYKYYTKQISVPGSLAGVVEDIYPEKITQELNNQGDKKIEDVLNGLLTNTGSSNRFSDLALTFIGNTSQIYEIVDKNKLYELHNTGGFNQPKIDVLAGEDLAIFNNNFKDILALKNYTNSANMWFGLKDKYGIDDRGRMILGRTVKVYTLSEVLNSVANVLGVRDGTDFAVFSSYIYLAYLDWYGLTNDLYTNEPKSDLNENIFNEENFISNIQDINNRILSEEELQDEILNYTYLMMSPTEGRDYRSKIILSGISDFIYEQYQRMVYGGATSYNKGLVTTRNSSGFLAVENYSENFMTAWFMEHYVSCCVYIILFGIVFMVILGLIRGKKLSWFLISILAIVNVTLVLPTTGEFVPYIANNVVQSLFEDKMTYWSISEQIGAAEIEANAVGTSNDELSQNGLTQDEEKQVYSLVQGLKSVYIDRYINVKQDIANKVTSASLSSFEEYQNLASARWMLPMIIREFTTEDSGADYVYVMLSDKLDNTGNLYWYYNDHAASFANTISSITNTGNVKYPASGNLGLYTSTVWSGWRDTINDNLDAEKYRSYAYTEVNDDKGLVHTYSYIIDEQGLINISTSDVPYENYSSYDEWATALENTLNSGLSTNLDAVYSDIVKNNESYDAYDRGSMKQVYGYLWYTESPLHYFYEVAAETFGDDSTVASIGSELQGSYLNDIRQSILVDDTGNIRDILDLEHMFKNTIPYLYMTQLYAGGYDGLSGYFGEQFIPDSDTVNFEGNFKSWLFRSNWVTKIMENPSLHGSCTIHYYDGDVRKSHTVANMLLPECYEIPGSRTMVFSEAQMIQQGLTEFDLSEVELRLVNLNREVYESWTLLLNYVSTSGITREILFRQMATDAMLIFNKSFETNSLDSIGFDMMPTSLDLRSISFDSIMTMLMLNVTHNTSFIYGDSMKVVIEDSDILTALLLLATAFMCTVLVPLMRCIALGLIFYLGFFAVARAIFGSTITRKKATLGFLGCNFIYLGITLIYFMLFKMLMVMTTSDEVLTVGSAEMNTGSPAWCLLFVLVISGIYMYASYRVIKFCVLNYKDMGLAVMSSVIEMVSSNVSAGFEKLANKLSGESGSNNALHGGSSVSKAPGSGTDGAGGNGSSPTAITNEDDLSASATGPNSVRGRGEQGVNESENDDALSSSVSAGMKEGYTGRSRTTASDIDSQVEAGANSSANYDLSKLKTGKQVDSAMESEQKLMEDANREYKQASEQAQSWYDSALEEGPSGANYTRKMEEYSKYKKQAEEYAQEVKVHSDNIEVIRKHGDSMTHRKTSRSRNKVESGAMVETKPDSMTHRKTSRSRNKVESGAVVETKSDLKHGSEHRSAKDIDSDLPDS